MMEISKEMVWVGAASVAAFLTPNIVYGSVAPGVSDIGTAGRASANANPDPAFWTRRTEIISSTVSLGVAVALSALAKSPWPFWAGVASVLLHLYLYESSLQSRRLLYTPGYGVTP